MSIRRKIYSESDDGSQNEGTFFIHWKLLFFFFGIIFFHSSFVIERFKENFPGTEPFSVELQREPIIQKRLKILNTNTHRANGIIKYRKINRKKKSQEWMNEFEYRMHTVCILDIQDSK